MSGAILMTMKLDLNLITLRSGNVIMPRCKIEETMKQMVLRDGGKFDAWGRTWV